MLLHILCCSLLLVVNIVRQVIWTCNIKPFSINRYLKSLCFSVVVLNVIIIIYTCIRTYNFLLRRQSYNDILVRECSEGVLDYLLAKHIIYLLYTLYMKESREREIDVIDKDILFDNRQSIIYKWSICKLNTETIIFSVN
jgi:hypothetical protein